MNKRNSLPKQIKPLKAIRAMCVECNGGATMQECKDLIRECVAKDCPLYDFRFGKNPHHKQAGKPRSTAHLRKARA